jgi:HK97 family phage prohead protease
MMQAPRTFVTEFETRAANDDGGSTIIGHAAVFNRYSQNLGGFVEQIAPGAFKRTLEHGADARALFNHDPSAILGRTIAGTLRLNENEKGLHYEIDIPDTTVGRDLLTSIQRGDITQSSFGFRVLDDDWAETDQGYPLRTVREVSMAEGDVSPVTFPAYLDTDTGARAQIRSAALERLAEKLGRPYTEIDKAAEDGEQFAKFLRGDIEKVETKPAEQAPPSIALMKHELLGKRLVP